MTRLRNLLAANGTRAAAGGALLVDGLTGVDVPGGRKRAGLFGSAFIVAVGVLIACVGWMWHGRHTPYPDGVAATATVTRIETFHQSEKTMYSRVYTFQTGEGRKVHFTEPERSTNRPGLGATAVVSYRPADPEGARVVPDTDWMPYGVMAMGGLVAVLGFGTFVVRLVSLGFGVYLLGSAFRRRND
ncbi:DUF3592 domain-containing protein [Actinoplanes sp. NPDC051475]|uniref:DUF3592 domain-containing protein n=1 Tax=Actinoplanes sp. NPDC051475 TaxID=3157225 RepID=UPI00344F5D7E